MSTIRAKSVCIFRNNEKILLAEGYDPIKNECYLLPIGGGIHFGETAEQAIRREVLEEIGAEVSSFELLGVLENLFAFNGNAGHEIVFVYDARFMDAGLYERYEIKGAESNGVEFVARWFDQEQINRSQLHVYPEGIANMLCWQVEASRQQAYAIQTLDYAAATRTASLDAQLIALVAKSNRLMKALKAARSLRLSSWCIGAGAVRNLVWDHLHGFEAETPAEDMDLVFFDEGCISQEFERDLERRLVLIEPGFDWEVVNQAGVHCWLEPHAAEPFGSLAEGIASWPEIATCVGVTLTGSGQIEVIAPHGLADLFEMVVRWNALRVSRAVFSARVAKKRFAERWPKVKIMAC